MSAHAALQNGLGIAFNVLSQQFAPGVTVKLLKVSEHYDEFDVVLEIENKRFFEFRESRQKVFLEIAQDTDILTDAIAEATHIGIDDDIYVINTGDTRPPKSTDATWKMFGDLFTRPDNWTPL